MSGPVRPEGTRRRKPAPEEEPLAELAALRPDTDRATQIALVARCLAHRHFRVVARAATLAGERGLKEEIPSLLAAYPRFLNNGPKKDPQCLAKQAIAQALVALDATDVELFLRGIDCRQLEPAYDGPNDTAVNVRIACAMGLVGTGWARAIPELTRLLADPQWRVRAGAARAISCGRRGEAESVLRLKVLTGDREPEVLGECFTGLLGVEPEESMPFVAGYLTGRHETLRDYAALALGESRHPAALGHLRAAWEGCPRTSTFRGVLIRAAGLHRSAAAFDWLIEVIERGTQTDADEAVDALSIYQRDTRLAERVQNALARRRASRKDADHTAPDPD